MDNFGKNNYWWSLDLVGDGEWEKEWNGSTWETVVDPEFDNTQADRYTSVYNHPKQGEDNPYTYDGNGNLVSDRKYIYEYDYLWSYDQGRMAESYNGDLSPKHTYLEGPLPGEHLAQEDWDLDPENPPISKPHYFIQDHNNSVTQLRDPTGEFEEARQYEYYGKGKTYDPNGSESGSLSSSLTRWGFNGAVTIGEVTPTKADNDSGEAYDPNLGEGLNGGDKKEGNPGCKDGAVGGSRCGPDVTDHVVSCLLELYKAIRMWDAIIDEALKNPFSDLGYVFSSRQSYFAFLGASLSLGKCNLKGGSAPTSGCPKGKGCRETLTICGYCLASDISGNVVYGMGGREVFGLKGAKVFPDLENRVRHGKPDSKEDVTSIEIGAALRPPVLEKGKEVQGLRLREAMKKKFCELLGNAVKEKKYEDKAKACPLCGEKFPEKAKGGKR